MWEFILVEEVLKQVEYFVDVFLDYKSDFVLFLEFFNVFLMGFIDQMDQICVICFLVGFIEQFWDEMFEMVVSYNINIIIGFMLLLENDWVYNVLYFCYWDGCVDEQRKIYIIFYECWDWVIEGGSDFEVFEIDVGWVVIMICYDIEFLELGWIVFSEDVDIIMVLFWIDIKNGYF